MHQKNLSSTFWHHALASLTIGFSTLGTIFLPATAAPIKDSFEIAQVSVRSRISPPTPLNLRPRTHLPLPTSNYSRYSRNRHHRYGSSHDRYHQDKPYNHRRDRYRHSRHGRHGDRDIIIIIRPNSKR